MRRFSDNAAFKKVAWSFLVATASIVLASCASTLSTPARSGAAADEFEDSGKRLEGDFLVAAIEDSYRGAGVRSQPPAMLSFDENGGFKRRDSSRVEEGAYLIASGGELVIYVEKVNGEPLTDARVEHYTIEDQKEGSITLGGPSRRFILRRR